MDERYIIIWWRKDNPLVRGKSRSPMDRAVAEAWCERMNAEHPYLMHKVVDVEYGADARQHEEG